MEFNVSILAGKRYDFTVEANSKKEAYDKAEELYNESEGYPDVDSEIDHETVVHGADEDETFDYLILTEDNVWASTGKGANQKELEDDLEEVSQRLDGAKLMVVKAPKLEIFSA